jgi:hypothetical protein
MKKVRHFEPYFGSHIGPPVNLVDILRRYYEDRNLPWVEEEFFDLDYYANELYQSGWPNLDTMSVQLSEQLAEGVRRGVVKLSVSTSSLVLDEHSIRIPQEFDEVRLGESDLIEIKRRPGSAGASLGAWKDALGNEGFPFDLASQAPLACGVDGALGEIDPNLARFGVLRVWEVKIDVVNVQPTYDLLERSDRNASDWILYDFPGIGESDYNGVFPRLGFDVRGFVDVRFANDLVIEDDGGEFCIPNTACYFAGFPRDPVSKTNRSQYEAIPFLGRASGFYWRDGAGYGVANIDGNDVFFGDFDGDGIDDWTEHQEFLADLFCPDPWPYMTDPDTDNDTLLDSDDDSRRADADNDFLRLCEELVLGTNPNNADTDGDGLIDSDPEDIDPLNGDWAIGDALPEDGGSIGGRLLVPYVAPSESPSGIPYFEPLVIEGNESTN